MAQVIEAKKDAAARQPPPLRFSRVFRSPSAPALCAITSASRKGSFGPIGPKS
jgi:hypothetical protein